MPRPRLESGVVLEIYRYRVQKLSIDKICDAMGFSVARGTVAKYVRHYDGLPGEIRDRDLAFEWSHLELARIPWEASDRVMGLWRSYELDKVEGVERLSNEYPDIEDIDKILVYFEPFTNRWATWCWRVHLAAKDLPDRQVLDIALEYSLAEQAHDLLPDKPKVDMRGWDDWLRIYSPYFSFSKEQNENGMAAVKAIYESVLGVGMVYPVPDIRAMFEFDSQLNGVAPRNSPLCIFSRIFGNRLELGLLNLDDETIERLKEEAVHDSTNKG